MKLPLLTFLILALATCQAQDAKESSHLTALKADIADGTYPKIESIIVERGDSLLVEEYFNGYGPDSLHDTRSSFKSITSLLAGIAIDKGLLKLNDSLYRFFPELDNKKKHIITVKDLLEMRSGLNCEEFYDKGPECERYMWDQDDWIAYCLGIKVKRKPGKKWSYSSNDPMIMGEVISRASGMSIMEFAKLNLFQPLGIVDYTWTLSPKGRGMTAGSFYMRPMDMLKITQLVDQRGHWNGKQIVSEAWIEQSTTCNIVLDFAFLRYARLADAYYESTRYGFYWYREILRYHDIETEVLFASGNGGQYMMLLPEYDAKVVFTGGNYGNWRGKLPFNILLKYLIPIMETK
ncbi:MAG: serine hydrolase domain-containing protein [Bacteroidia bacterium]